MLGGKQVGPFDIQELRRRTAAGEVMPRTYLWHAGMDGWKRAADLSEVSSILAHATPFPTRDVAVANEVPSPELTKPTAQSGAGAVVSVEKKKPSRKTDVYAEHTPQAEAIVREKAAPAPSHEEHDAHGGDPFAALSHNDGKQAPPIGEATRFFIAQAGVNKRNPPWKIALFVLAFIGGPLAIIYILNTFEIVKLPTVTRTDEDGQEVQESFFSAGGAAGLRDLLTGSEKKRQADAEQQRRTKEAIAARARNDAKMKAGKDDEPEVVVPRQQDQALSDFYNESPPGGRPIKIRNKYENEGGNATAVNTSGLSREASLKVIADKSRAFQTCIDNALRRNPKLAVGGITVTLSVGPSGAVKSAGIDPKKHENSDWGQCMMSTGRRIVFPRSDAETQLEIPFKVGVALGL